MKIANFQKAREDRAAREREGFEDRLAQRLTAAGITSDQMRVIREILAEIINNELP